MKNRFSEENIEQNLKDCLSFIGEDVTREGLIETPKRIVKSWKELYAGYHQDPEDILKTTFVEGSCKEMVVLKQIDFFSTCEHHFLPFFGSVDIGYIPDEKVVGLSKLARLVDIFSRRMQIQEKMTSQIADTLMEVLKPKGCIVKVQAQHLCMLARGVKKANATMVTSAIRGVFEKQEVRQEFAELIK